MSREGGGREDVVSPRYYPAHVWNLCLFDLEAAASPAARDLALKAAKLLRHRGPDWSGICRRARRPGPRAARHRRCRARRAAARRSGGPVLAVNGEIYNHRDLREGLARRTIPDRLRLRGDPISLRASKAPTFLNRLNGIFAFVLYDPRRRTLPHRPRPDRRHPALLGLATSRQPRGGLRDEGAGRRLRRVSRSFPRATTDRRERTSRSRYYDARRGPSFEAAPGLPRRSGRASRGARRRGAPPADVRRALRRADLGRRWIRRSSPRVAARFARSGSRTRPHAAWWPRLHSFAVGLEARRTCAARASRRAHRHGPPRVHFTVQEGIDALRDVIWHIETFDVTTSAPRRRCT